MEDKKQKANYVLNLNQQIITGLAELFIQPETITEQHRKEIYKNTLDLYKLFVGALYDLEIPEIDKAMSDYGITLNFIPWNDHAEEHWQFDSAMKVAIPIVRKLAEH